MDTAPAMALKMTKKFCFRSVAVTLVVSTRVLGTTEILLLNHTGCGFTTFTDDELNAKLSPSTGDASPVPMRFFS